MRRSRAGRGQELVALAGVATVAMLAGVLPASADQDRGHVEGVVVSQQQPVQVVLGDGSVADGRLRSNLHVLEGGDAKGWARLEYERRGVGGVVRTERVELAYESARMTPDSGEALVVSGTATSSACGAAADCLEFSITAHPEHTRSGGDCLIYDIVGPNLSGQVHAIGRAIGFRHERTRPE